MSKKFYGKPDYRHPRNLPRLDLRPAVSQPEQPALPVEKGGIMVKVILAAVCYVLSTEFGFGKERLNKLIASVIKFVVIDEGKNDTFVDEIAAWVERKGLNL